MVKTKLKETESALSISRISGGTWSGNSYLTDSGASFSICQKINDEDKVSVVFGYTSDSNKKYYRDIQIENHQIIEIRDYLNKIINNSNRIDDYYYVCIDPRKISFLKKNSINVKSTTPSIVRLKGFQLVIYEVYSNNKTDKKNLLFNIVRSENDFDILTLPLLKFQWRKRTKIENLYDLRNENSYKSYHINEIQVINESKESVKAGVHQLFYFDQSFNETILSQVQYDEFKNLFLDFGFWNFK